MSDEKIPVYIVSTDLGISPCHCLSWSEVVDFLRENVLSSEIGHATGDDIEITVSLRLWSQKQIEALGEWEP